MGLHQFLERLEAKVDRLLLRAESPTLNVTEAMALTGHAKKSAFYQSMIALGVRPFRRGHYRRVDLTNAMGRRALELARGAKTDAAAEAKAEGRIRDHAVNYHDE